MHKLIARICALALLAPVAAGCGPELVQLYEGAKLPDDQVTSLYTNKHLVVTIDRRYEVPADKRSTLQRLDTDPGHHAVEVQCLYTDDVTYHAAEGENADGVATATPTPASSETITASPIIALPFEGKAGSRYKLRVHFERDKAGVPGCHVKVFNVTKDISGAKIDLY